MSEEISNIDQMEMVLRNMWLDHKIDENKYQAGLISIANSYAMLDKKEEARGIISRLSSKFLNEVLLDYLDLDPLLKAKALAVAEYLNEDMVDINKEDVNIDLMIARMNPNERAS